MSTLTFSYCSPFSTRTILGLRARGDMGKSYSLIMGHLLVVKSCVAERRRDTARIVLRTHTVAEKIGQPALVLAPGQGLQFPPVQPHPPTRGALFHRHLVVLERHQLLPALGAAHEGLLAQRHFPRARLLLLQFREQFAVALGEIAVLFGLLLLLQFPAQAIFFIH